MTGKRGASHMTSGRLVTLVIVGLTSAASCRRDPSPDGAPVVRASAANQPGAAAASSEGRATLSRLRSRLLVGRSSEPLLSAGPAHSFRTVAGRMSPAFPDSVGRATAGVTLPARSAGSFHLEDAATGAGVDVALKEVKDVQGEIEEGFVIYSGAHISGATVLQRPGLSGNEDFVSFESRPPEQAVSYELTIGPKVAGLRLVANTLEMLDAGGAPRLRVAPPYIVGADGARTDATLAVRGCAVDTVPSAPWGRPVTAPGAVSCTVRVSWDSAAVVYPAVLDPSWTTTTNTMVSARQDHTATLMSNGVVLVAGGRDEQHLDHRARDGRALQSVDRPLGGDGNHGRDDAWTIFPQRNPARFDEQFEYHGQGLDRGWAERRQQPRHGPTLFAERWDLVGGLGHLELHP